MNTLPIAADNLDFVFSAKLPAAFALLSAADLKQCDDLLPNLPDRTLGRLVSAFPYTVSFYPTPDGWLCTTRRAMPANEKVPGIAVRELDPACCWDGATPAGAMLNMIADRLESKELSYSKGGADIHVMGRFMPAVEA